MSRDQITISVDEYKELLELKVGPPAYRDAARREPREGRCQEAVREAVEAAYEAARRDEVLSVVRVLTDDS